MIADILNLSKLLYHLVGKSIKNSIIFSIVNNIGVKPCINPILIYILDVLIKISSSYSTEF